jgi:biotin transport system substrate-specific component
MTAAVRPRPLADRLFDRFSPLADRPAWRATVLALFGSALLWLSAKAQVPMWPVPMTMQSFVVLVIGITYGTRLAGATVLLYLAEGASGLPVFAGTPEKGIGIAYMLGPTGGYLAGFLVAAMALGWLAERGWDRGLVRLGLAMAIGTVLLFLPGVAWLAALIGWPKAVAAGLTPFIAGSVVKLALGVAVVLAANRAIER